MNRQDRATPDRRAGWWGIAFLVVLFVGAGMISLPTAADPGGRIKAFYAAHKHVIIAAQVVGALGVVPLLLFVVALHRRTRGRLRMWRRWLIPSGVLVSTAEFATILPPLGLALMSDPSSATAHALTRAEDLTDAALFGSIALFSLAASDGEPLWLRALGLVVAVLTLIRAVASPLGASALDAVAPLAFVTFVLLLSIRMLVKPVSVTAAHSDPPATGATGSMP